MEYLFVFITLLILELLYFKIADRFNIIDKPNLRSSHNSITLRGGGIIFYFSSLIYFITNSFVNPWFFLGLSFMAIISFLDDIMTLSNKVRLLVHFGSVLLMVYQLDIFSLPWYYLLLTFIIVVGVINAYNFMDGINGITALYSIVVGILLLIVNQDWNFVSNKFLIYTLLGLFVFGIFNVRQKAKTFAGDVGSVSIAYILLFCLGSLILESGNFIYILFLSVYGVDTVWTILRRLSLKENIFEAHRSHLYQYLGNEAKINKLTVSTIYALIQLVLGLLVIWVSKFSAQIQLIFFVIVLISLSAVYIYVKNYILKKHVISQHD